MVSPGIAVEVQPTEPIFEKCPHLREKGGVLTLKTPRWVCAYPYSTLQTFNCSFAPRVARCNSFKSVFSQHAAMVQEAYLKIYARGVVSYFYFPAGRARARAENQANQQFHFKSSRCRSELLDTDSCRGTVPMEPPMSNISMRHQNPNLNFDDTRIFLQGASCTIAAQRSLIAQGWNCGPKFRPPWIGILYSWAAGILTQNSALHHTRRAKSRQ